MLVTPAFTFLSLAFNFGTILLLHGSDPNFVTTKRNFQRSIQTIELAATDSWSSIATRYKDIFYPPSVSPASSFSFVDRAEWIYRSSAVRILRSLDGSTSHSSRTPSSSRTFSFSPTSLPIPISTDITLYIPTSTDITLPIPTSTDITLPIPTSTDIVLSTPASSDITLSVPTSTDITLYIPVPPTCSISNAPFVVDYVEHPWETPGFIEMNLPRFWSLVLCVLIFSVNCVWPEVVHKLSLFSSSRSPLQFQGDLHVDAPGTKIEPTYEAHNDDPLPPPSSYIGSVATFMDADLDWNSNSDFAMDSGPQVFTLNTVDIPSLPRALPITVTTSNGRVLFKAEVSLSPNHIISTSPSSVKFSVDVVAFQNLSSRKPHLPSFSLSSSRLVDSLRGHVRNPAQQRQC